MIVLLLFWYINFFLPGAAVRNAIYPPLVLENTFQTMIHKQGEDDKQDPLCPPTGTRCELCPPGWQLHRGRCYFFSEETRSWEDSQKNCLARKSQLLVIEDEIEMVSLAAALKTYHRPQVNISPRVHGRQAWALWGRGSDSLHRSWVWECQQSRAEQKHKRCQVWKPE